MSKQMTHEQMTELAARLRFVKHTADWIACDEAADLIEQMAQAKPVATPLVRAFNEGYMSGHHDTVEACFVDIHHSDMDTYHADVVADLGLSLAPPAREPLTADLIERMAQPEPIATVYYPRTGGNVGVSWRAIPETGVMPPEGAKLYLAPPAREPLSDEQIMDLVRDDCGVMRWPSTVLDIARAIEQAHGIRSEK